jgi:opacity protein-like surface antigen
MTRPPGWRRVGILVAAVALPAVASAEPHFAARTGLRCARCHTSPTGGGKRTPYGALYAHAALSLQGGRPRTRLPAAEDSSWALSPMAVGEVTSWLAVGTDLRVTNTTTFTDERQNSFDATGGTLYLEIRPWPDRIVLYLDEEVAAGGARSREAWALIHGPWTTYLRGGWLLPPFGLRLLDDDAYTRRVTGANFANSDLGLEVGLDLGPVFAALALTNGNFSASDADVPKALWGLVEATFDPLRVGLTGAWNPSEDGCRGMAGAFGALRLGRLVVQAEADYVTQRPPDKARWGHGMAWMAELDLQLLKGLSLRAGYDYHDADLELRQDRRQRFRFGVDLFPLRMVELKLYYMLKQSQTTQPLDDADRLEVTLHVYL